MSNKKIHLVISSNNSFWSKDNLNLIFSEFCLNETDKSQFPLIKVEYNSDDFKTLNNKINSNVLKYESEYLEDIICFLNNRNNKNQNTEYWKIIILPCLRIMLYHIITIYHKIDFIFLKYSIESATICSHKYIEISKDYLDFQHKLSNMVWNEKLISKILLFYIKEKKIKIDLKIINEIITSQNLDCETNKYGQYNKFNSIKDIIRNYIVKILDSFPVNNNGPMIVTSFLPFYNDFILKLLHKQNPCQWDFVNEPLNIIDYKLYKRIYKPIISKNPLNFFVSNLVFQLMPRSYLEDFSYYVNNIKKLRWPNNPNFIFTSNSHITDDMFKIWVAEIKQKKNIKYFVGQHGNGYGTHSHQWGYNPVDIIISDYFLSWGWSGNDKVIPSVLFKRTKKLFRSNHKTKIIIITNSIDHRVPLSNFLYDYNSIIIKSQIRFLSLLSINILDNSLIRLRHKYTNFYGKEEYLFRLNFPKIKIECGEAPFTRLEKMFSFVIFTYDSTGMLECLYIDKPFITLISQYELDVLTEDAKQYYKILMDANIIFNDENLAAEHVNLIVLDVLKWWNSDKVKKAKTIFKNKYLKTTFFPGFQIFKIINQFK